MPELNVSPAENASAEVEKPVAAPEEVPADQADAPAPETEAPAEQAEAPAPQTDGEAPAEPEEEEVPAGPDYLKMALASGILPMETRYSQINHPYRKVPIAYRSFTYLNSIVSGVVPPEKYSYAADATEIGVRLSRHNIITAMRTVRKMEEAGRKVEFITARCSPSLALEPDMYEWMRALMEENGFDKPEKLCLEFPQSLLFEDAEQVKLSLLGMKLLKVRTMMSGCGADDCPVANLIDIPVDIVLLAPKLTQMLSSRAKNRIVLSLVQFFRALPAEVIADGVTNDEQIATLSRSDCFGYIPASNYSGNVIHGRLRMTLDEATSQKEEEI